MGVYKQGILGPFSGKVGQVVGSNWRGVYYMRSLAPHVSNPKTVAQQQVRGRFAACVKTLRPFVDLFRYSFKGIDGLKGWSGAIRANYPMVTENSGEYSLNYEDVLWSNSDIVAGISASLSAGKITFTWDAPDSYSVFVEGSMLYLIYSETLSRVIKMGLADIDSGTLEVSNDAFTTKDAKIFSVGMFITETEVSSADFTSFIVS